ncbi:uncharacterized protein LOC121425472 [Lytechinus variegatus]|uniref:uncharacterized protein LOC121425472 n=1 Tax=Lytechinus variegatus TaxID=7654 RepID=UPI001BB28F9A|nr:uncharacterized protein LOC121425472 [Lytechinus variegatus]
MSVIEEGWMSRYKSGKRKNKEHLVHCKLISHGAKNCPEVHLYTDSLAKEPSAVVQVSSVAAVRESDEVPKIVKARYDNYIAISDSKGKITYLSTNTREEKEKWCNLLQKLVSKTTTSNQESLQPYLERTQTVATSDRPPVSRARRGAPVTSPGTMQGIFHDELHKVLDRTMSEPTASLDEEIYDCPDSEFRNDFDKLTLNVRKEVREEQEWRRKQALRDTRDMYAFMHKTHQLQEDHNESGPYSEIREFRSESLMSDGKRLPAVDRTSEVLYENSAVSPYVNFNSNSLVPEDEDWIYNEPEQEDRLYDFLPTEQPSPHRSSLKLPVTSQAMEMEALCRKLKKEKVARSTKVLVDKATLVRVFTSLSLKEINDCILVTAVPPELKDSFRVGDQWLTVNGNYLSGVSFVKDCVYTSHKIEIEITVRRIPFGQICDFPWTSKNMDDIGLELTGNEIRLVSSEGLAYRRGSLHSHETQSLNIGGLRCNYIITEINFDPVPPGASTAQVWDMIKKAGRKIILILHPQDFFNSQSKGDLRRTLRSTDVDVSCAAHAARSGGRSVSSYEDYIEAELCNVNSRDAKGLESRSSWSSSGSSEEVYLELDVAPDELNIESVRVEDETTLPPSSRLMADGANPPDNLSTSTKKALPDRHFCEGEFDTNGGVMSVSSHTMTIPPGALDTSVKITLSVLRDVPDDVQLQDGDTVVTYGFWCQPSGLRFAAGKPAKLTIPHSANLIDPQKIQTVLYSWSHHEKDGDESMAPERIVQTEQTCHVTPHNIEINLEHFSGGFLAFIWNWLYMDKKLISIMPFLPKMMPISRRLIMELRMVDKPHGISWKDLHVLDQTARYQPAKDDDDEMIVEDEDLIVSLTLEDDPPVNKDVKAELLKKTTKHTEYFDLDLNDKLDDSLVILKLKQSQIEMDIQFRSQFFEAIERDHSGSECNMPPQVETIGQYTTTPPPPTTTTTGEQIENDGGITELFLVGLADQLGNQDDIELVALNLGFTHQKWKQYSDMNGNERITGTRRMLFDWKKCTARELQRSRLREALEKSNNLELAETV